MYSKYIEWGLKHANIVGSRMTLLGTPCFIKYWTNTSDIEQLI